MSQEELCDVLPVNLRESLHVAQVHLIKNDPAIQKCLTDLVHATKQLESMGIPARLVEQVFTAELSKSLFRNMVRQSLS